MKRLGRASVAIALYLLASAATAHAECAWVRWWQAQAQPWEPREAFDTRAACEDAVKKDIAWLSETYPGSRILGEVIALRTEKGEISIGNRCLPDTVDPRGPKGK